MAQYSFSPIDIGSRRQLFIDEVFFAERDGVELVMNPPDECGPAIRADAPWDAEIYGFTTVLNDPAGDGLHRMYYLCASERFGAATAVAVSSDGIH